MANSIGSTLRDARIRARIDMAEVEANTKIRAKYLRAIENEEWDLLPGPVYVKSFLRTYGDYLGLDSRMLVEDFKRQYERPADHELQPIAPPRRDRERERARERDRGGRPRFAPPPWAAIVAVLVVVLIVLFVIGKNSGGNSGSNSSQSTSLHGRAHGKTHSAPAHTTPTHAATTPQKPRTVTVQLVPTAPVYVCLVNGAGKRLIAGVTYSAGQTVPSHTAREFFLTLGNPSVHLKVNGKPVTVPASATPLGYRIRPRGTSLLPASSLPFKCA
jgi:cytoskeletal protein RodZ